MVSIKLNKAWMDAGSVCGDQTTAGVEASWLRMVCLVLVTSGGSRVMPPSWAIAISKKFIKRSLS